MSGGGTAGHIYPALALAQLLLESAHDEVKYFGTSRGPEADLVTRAGIPFVALPARGFVRNRPWTLISAMLVLAGSVFRALSMMLRQRPDVVVVFGGYVCIPVGIAAILTRVPLIIHEQNSVAGLANRILGRWARVVALTYPESAVGFERSKRVVVTGNPVRPSVRNADSVAGRRALGIPPDALVLLVFGGSRGAQRINQALAEAHAKLLEIDDLHIVHVTGKHEYTIVRRTIAATGSPPERYHLLEYIDDMGGALAAADLIVARAGATSIAEITVLQKPAIYVPYPHATDDHQTKNAASLAQAGAAVVISDGQLQAPVFIETVTALLVDSAVRDNMAAALSGLAIHDAAERLAELTRHVHVDG